MTMDSAIDVSATLLPRWAAWRSRGMNGPLAAFARPKESPTAFFPDRLLVAESEAALIQRLAEQGAEIVPELPVADPPPELHEVARAARPERFVRVRFPGGLPSALHDDGLHGAAALARRMDGLAFSDEHAAALVGFAGLQAEEGRKVSLDQIGNPTALPLLSIPENPAWGGAGPDVLQWPAFAGNAQIVHAWWLVASYYKVRSLPLIWIAICDSGFWLDGNGVPFPGADGGSDFETPPQWNFETNTRPAGGPSGFKSSDGSDAPWHGNGVASAACARVGNNRGAAGSGGLVARPMMFKLESGTTSALLSSLAYAVAWGAKVVNISLSYKTLVFPSLWDERFAFAAANDVAIFCSAGNQDRELPDYDIRPATRTPGVLTVGALDGSGTAKFAKSNYGSSVSIWAPGMFVPVAPDENNLNGSTMNGTSIASPIVAGVAAMVRSIDPSLSPQGVFDLLIETAKPGPHPATRLLDAYGAVLKAMGGRLPRIADNEIPSRAAALLPDGTGQLVPFAGSGPFAGSETLSGSAAAYWTFSLDEISTVTVTLSWYAYIGALDLGLECDDPDVAGLGTVAMTGGTRSGGVEGWSTLTALLGPGVYRLRVGGRSRVFGRKAATAYELAVRPTPAKLRPDSFEWNNSLASAAPLAFVRSSGSPLRLTVHENRNMPSLDEDWFVLDVPPDGGDRRIALIKIFETDEPLVVTLLDTTGAIVEQHNGVRSAELRPPRGTRLFLHIAAARQTRYSLAALAIPDPHFVPKPWEKLPEWPDWTDDPDPIKFDIPHKQFVLPIDRDEWRKEGLALQAPPGTTAQLLDQALNVVAEGRASRDGALTIDAPEAGPGAHLLEFRLPAQEAKLGASLRVVAPAFK